LLPFDGSIEMWLNILEVFDDFEVLLFTLVRPILST
jgi:hypothetical protein